MWIVQKNCHNLAQNKLPKRTANKRRKLRKKEENMMTRIIIVEYFSMICFQYLKIH